MIIQKEMNCGIRLEAVGVPYAEGAHIKGLEDKCLKNIWDDECCRWR